MSRRHAFLSRVVKQDYKYSSVKLAKFINYVMLDGKKDISRKIVYNSLKLIKSKYEQDNPIETFNAALENVRPLLSVKPVRVGGSTYQVPYAVNEEKGISIAMKWIIKSAKKRAENSMQKRVAEEIFDAFNNRGVAIKTKEDTHKMAESNRSYAHFSPNKSKI